MVRRLTYPSSVCAVWLLASAVAAAPTAKIEDVALGLGGRFKLGHWAPVRVTVRAEDQPIQGDLGVTVPDGDGLRSRYVGGALANVSIPAGEQRTIESYVRIGRRTGNATVRLLDQEAAKLAPDVTRNVSDFGPAIPVTTRWVVVIGQPIGLDQAKRYLARGDSEGIETTRLDKPAQLPGRWYGYDGVSLLVLTTGDAEFYEQLTPDQRDAIVQWVRQGGKVMLTMGAGGERLLAEDSYFAQIAPGKWRQTAPLRDTAALESLAESVVSMNKSVDGRPPPPVMATGLRGGDLHVLLTASGNRPLVTHGSQGFGQVWFVGIDLDRPPIAGWPDGPRLAARLLEFALREQQPPEDSNLGNESAQYGFNDLSGQMRAALDQFAGVAVLPFSLIAGVMVIYILLIGPADYFLLKRIGRMEWTWVTLTAAVLLFCGAAWRLAAASRGRQVLVNQVDIVDIDVQTSLVRGTSWLRLYSPQSGSFNLSLNTIDDDWLTGQRGVLFSWQGLPGSGLGGMNAPQRPFGGGQPYTIRNTGAADQPPQMEIQGLPVGYSTTKGFLARWWSRTDLKTANSLERRADSSLVGTIFNPLPVRLDNCVLYHEGRAYQLGSLEPGQAFNMDGERRYSNVRWMLTERKFIDGADEFQPWDHAMRDDVSKLVRMMMFHEAAGGRSHTGLFHRYQGFIDFSGHLPSQRAILVGRAEENATQLSADGQPLTSAGNRHWTYYRIVLATIAAD